jgi:hypothetical protein
MDKDGLAPSGYLEAHFVFEFGGDAFAAPPPDPLDIELREDGGHPKSVTTIAATCGNWPLSVPTIRSNCSGTEEASGWAKIVWIAAMTHVGVVPLDPGAHVAA